MNAAYNDTGSTADLEKILRAKLEKLLTTAEVRTLIGDWTMAWGPAVWKHPLNFRGYSDNTAAVFHNAATNTYVCAIAATNANSVFDWAVEDFWVSDKVRWQYSPARRVPWLSAATNFGIGMLLSLRDPGTGVFLSDFLASVASPAATLVVTGHSLAGALSPTLAMVLYGTPQARLAWNQVLVFPTAGATPGNGAFATAFAEQFPAQTTGANPWQRWNTLMWNSLDVVPHAWAPFTMLAVPVLYEATPVVKAEIGAIIAYCLYQAGIDYVHLTNQSLKGTQRPGTVSDIKAFLAEMGYQHVDAYFDLLGVPEIVPYYKSIVGAPPPSEDSAQAALALARSHEAEIKASGVLEAVRR